jgi:hypothetical protein
MRLRLAFPQLRRPPSWHWRRFRDGVVLGIVNPAVIMILMIAFGGRQIQGFGLQGAEWIVYPLGWLGVMLMIGFFEGIGFWPAATVITMLFGAAHLGKEGENVVDIASVWLPFRL